ncbi:chromate transporter [Treponema sp. TIM-1]|uniref:chromate transporter n=1 Tax=Treponema sp. TIM-1 TaxID=2898417 RepID=UPI00397F0838
MIFLILFGEFFKIGLFAVGGGLATLPFLYRLADHYDWLSYETIADMIAISESTPGAIGVNMATYAGFQAAGIAGAVIATLGLITPSIIVILIVARILTAFRNSPVVASVFQGLRPAATGLIAAAGLGVIRLSLYSGPAPRWYDRIHWPELALFVLLFLLIYRFKKHPVWYILAAGAAGIVLGL